VYTERYDLKEILASLYTENCFFVFCFSLSPFTNETPSLKGVHIFSTTDGDVRKKRNVATLSESVYASFREASPLFYLLSLPTSFFCTATHTHLNLEFSPLSLKKKLKKTKQEFALIPGFRTKKNSLYIVYNSHSIKGGLV